MTSSALSLELDTPDLARHYEQVSLDRQFRAGQVLVQRLVLHPGERVLDVGCGTGLLAAPAGIRLTSARLVAVASKPSRS